MATTGVDVSRDFIAEVLQPQLETAIGADLERLAIAIIGTGSDVIGLDDEISHDHHWGPRANVMYLRDDAARLRPVVERVLTREIPREYAGFEVHIGIGNLTGVCCTAVEDFFARFLGTDELPKRDLDWLALCEVDLFHVTGGSVVHDGPGELSRRRAALAYYPDAVWKKRLADWCMYVTGRDAPYNIHRVSRRGDELTSAIYLGLCLKRMMELCFTVNRQYAPYTKWLNRLYRRLPLCGDSLAGLLDEVVAETSWRRRVDLLVDANYVLADALAEMGLTEPVERRAFDEGLTDLTLYDSAAQIYRTLPPELFAPSFNQIELWEKMAREVLFDANDYLQTSRDGTS